jgi:hypothetical protein
MNQEDILQAREKYRGDHASLLDLKLLDRDQMTLIRLKLLSAVITCKVFYIP